MIPSGRPILGKEWKLCVIVGAEKDLWRTARAALRGGGRVVQYRGKTKSGAVQLSESLALRELTRRFRAFLVINDRPDIARLSGADGVHLGETDLPVPVARRILGKGKIIGATAHSLREALAAEREGADYVGCGSVFISPSKPGVPVLGSCAFTEITRRIRIPVLGIGGITKKNAPEVLQKGACGVAVLSAVSEAVDPESTVRELLGNLSRASVG